jgi:hypothetical protein
MKENIMHQATFETSFSLLEDRASFDHLESRQVQELRDLLLMDIGLLTKGVGILIFVVKGMMQTFN